MHDLFTSIQLVRIFFSMLQEGGGTRKIGHNVKIRYGRR